MASLISPSVMCADQLNLLKDIQSIERVKTDYYHFDIMDGVFVPNYTLGTDLIDNMRRYTTTPFDIHLMVERPELKMEYFYFKE